MMQSGQRERGAEPATLRGRVDAEDVDLAEILAVHLRPVKAQQLAAARVDGHEQSGGVEPRFAAALGDVGVRPPALFGMPCERGVVDSKQFGVVVRAGVRRDAYAVGSG